jgi:hypothetical protein
MIMKSYIFIFLIINFLISCSQKKYITRIILLPDTQSYAAKYPQIINAQIDWIKKHSRNIDFVLQQGDLTNNNKHPQWQVIKHAFSKLDHVVPYVLAAGNHDMGEVPKLANNRNTDLFNQYFPFIHMSKLEGFRDVYEKDKMENAWYVFKTKKIQWLVLNLEFGPRNKVLDWANQLVSQHPDKVIILNTHAYLYSDNTHHGPGHKWLPQQYGIGKDTAKEEVNDGVGIWNKLVKLHPNIRFVFSGHVLNSGVGTLISYNDHGYAVYQMLANYQQGVEGSINGGNGWLRIVDVGFKKNVINVKTFSPFINQYLEHPAHEFKINNLIY